MPWGNINPLLQHELFKVRSEIGIKRQPELEPPYSQLKSLIDIRDTTPFERFDPTINSDLCACSSLFEKGAQWQIADIKPNPYFYRIETFDSFQRKNQSFFLDLKNYPDGINLDKSETRTEENFNILVRNFKKSNEWTELSNTSTAFYCYREISWWTNEFDFSKEASFPVFNLGEDLTKLNSWIIEFGFKVGFSTDWYSENLLFLRLDSRKLDNDKIRVPSIIDGFCQPIFSPRDILETPTWGLAYDLKTIIQPKNKEFVIRDIPPSAIDFIPVKINLSTLNDIALHARITDDLVNTLINTI